MSRAPKNSLDHPDSTIPTVGLVYCEMIRFYGVRMADDIMVLAQGRIVDYGKAQQFLTQPSHPRPVTTK